MALRQIPLATPPKTDKRITLTPSPFNPGATGKFQFKHTELKALAGFMAARFKRDVVYGEYELAKALNVHRCIADEWLSALVRFNMVESVHLRNPLLELQCLAFKIPRALHETYATSVHVDVAGLDHYDPWVDRGLDGIVARADTPHEFCDKYYDVTQHEYYLVNKRQRIRPNQHMFIPVWGDTFTTILSEHKPLTDELRQAFNAAASGARTMSRPT